MAEWLCSGLQSRLPRFDSESRLQMLFPPLSLWGRLLRRSDAPYPTLTKIRMKPRGRQSMALSRSRKAATWKQSCPPYDATMLQHKAPRKGRFFMGARMSRCARKPDGGGVCDAGQKIFCPCGRFVHSAPGTENETALRCYCRCEAKAGRLGGFTGCRKLAA